MMDTKHKLQFSQNGTFRVLMMSDIQESTTYDKRSLQSICAVLDQAKPDLVVLGGDNCCGPEIHSLQEFEEFLRIFAAPMEERGIPWAHVYGNHDHDVPCDINDMQRIYESYPMCVSSHTDDTVHGKSNFVLPIYDHSGQNIVFNVWGLDTNHEVSALNHLVPEGNMEQAANLPQNPLYIGAVWDGLYFDQLMWYWNTSCAMEKEWGYKIPGLLCMHMAPQEFVMAQANPQRCVKNGNYSEELSAAVFNSGIFSQILQRGDIKTISCGHTHMNDFEAEYCGIRLCWDACVGYRCYGIDSLRGGRLFEIKEEDPWNLQTTMVRTLEHLAEYEGIM